MKMEDIQRVVVIGAGVMGRGIAMVCAQAGYQALLYDLNPDVLDTARSFAEGFWQKSVARGKMTEEGRSQSRPSACP